ncbi:MAG: hypothetical protein AAGF11_20090 [Myxococcota bacterium]
MSDTETYRRTDETIKTNTESGTERTDGLTAASDSDHTANREGTHQGRHDTGGYVPTT